jgi:single-strand selective monofunctional uracil DNA glycosylase
MSRTIVDVSKTLRERLRPMRFAPPVTHVYDPLQYAWAPHESYLRRYGAAPRDTLLIGMNPGPFGMAQTGVPFGEIAAVRDWLGIEGAVGKPPVENAARPITGFACKRSEVSGQRLWGWARDTFGTPEKFFARFFVWNYCPLMFMEESGRNRTPDKLPAGEAGPLFAACDDALREVAALLRPKLVVGVGAFAEDRTERALEGTGVRIGRILHPSPASPLANRGWAAEATRELRDLGAL